MNKIIYKIGNIDKVSEVKSLYEDAEWTSYTKDIQKLIKALNSSLFIITAWDGDELVGLVRVVGDGLTIIYIQDILVRKSYKRKGIGTQLLQKVLHNFKDVRQKVLLTDEKQEIRKFYEKNGFFSCDEGIIVAFAKFD